MKTISKITTRATENSPGQKPDFSFRRCDRLRSRKVISQLYQEGNKLNAGPLRVFYRQPAAPVGRPAVVAVSVPKRLFRKAVDRNLLKRRLRESYRLQKPRFFAALNQLDIELELMIQCRERSLPDYARIDAALRAALDKLIAVLGEGSSAGEKPSSAAAQ